MKKITTYVFYICGGACIVIGRIQTFHMTEGEAFISALPLWLAAIFLIVCGIIWSSK